MPLVKAGTHPTGDIEGGPYGASVSVILDEGEHGHGPRLHRHPYDETWVVVEGTVTFLAGDETIVASPGDVVVVPPELPHRFTNTGAGRSRMVCIHASPGFVTEWLE